MYGLKQLTQPSTHVTCSTSTLIDHILTCGPSRVSEKCVIIVGVSNHQLISCARKVSRIKTDDVDKYLNFRSLKNYNGDCYKEVLKQADLSNYENLVMLIILMTIIGKIAPYKSKRVKGDNS